MKMPNGYGSVIKLSGKRRKPYAVRVTTGYINAGTDEAPRARQTYRYLEYFSKRSEAINYLANYNSGVEVKEHTNTSDIPTFAECYDRWFAEREKMSGGLSASRVRSYTAAFKRMKSLHNMRISSVRYADVQPVLDKASHMSQSSIDMMVTVLRGVSAYAYKWEFTDTDFARHIHGVGKGPGNIHTPFTVEEIETLWQFTDDTGIRFALMTIYTGMRPSELLLVTPDNIHIEEKYIVAGIKTRAGIDRIIPMNHKVAPFFQDMKDNGAPWGNVDLRVFRYRYWNKGMEKAGLNHLPDDGRHTCATLMEKAGIPLYRRKLILGHSVRDITEGTYTHVSPKDLIEEIEKI